VALTARSMRWLACARGGAGGGYLQTAGIIRATLSHGSVVCEA
jgi:hypothetical protein